MTRKHLHHIQTWQNEIHIIRLKLLDFLFIFLAFSSPTQTVHLQYQVFWFLQHLLAICMHCRHKAERLEPIYLDGWYIIVYLIQCFMKKLNRRKIYLQSHRVRVNNISKILITCYFEMLNACRGWDCQVVRDEELNFRSDTWGSKRSVRVPEGTCWGFLWTLTAMCNLLC